MNPFALTILSSVVVNGVFFAYAVAKKTDVVTDLSYSLSFGLVSAALIALNASAPAIALVPAALNDRLGAEAGRLSFRTHNEDESGPPLRWHEGDTAEVRAVLDPPGYRGGPHHASCGCFGRVRRRGAELRAPRGPWAFALWVAGFGMETAADAQKAAFKRSGARGFMSGGLWKYSRHPKLFRRGLALVGFVPVHGARTGGLADAGDPRADFHYRPSLVRERHTHAREKRRHEVWIRSGLSRVQAQDERLRPPTAPLVFLVGFLPRSRCGGGQPRLPPPRPSS